MTGLDRMDAHRGGQEFGIVEPWGLLLVGGHREILEGDGGRPEFRLILGDALEVELRLLDRLCAKERLESLDVRTLVRADAGLAPEPSEHAVRPEPAAANDDTDNFNARRNDWRTRFRNALTSRRKESDRGND